MARRTTPVPPATLADDHATLLALQGLPDYQPVNPNYAVGQLLQLQVALTQAEQTERTAEIALEQARQMRYEAANLYHDSVVGARVQVRAQYGPDAAAIALIGLKRKSDRKQPARRETKAE